MENHKNEVLNKQQETISLSKLIQENTKIRELIEYSKLREALVYAYALIGLDEKYYPVGLKDEVLIDFIKGAYGGIVCQEIKIAFKMAVQHKFEEVEINCFQNFSPEYFGRIMKAYYSWRTAKLKEESNLKITYTQPEIDNRNFYEKTLFEPYEKMLSGSPYPFSRLDGIIFFDDFYKMKMPIVYDDEQKKEYLSQARLLTPRAQPKSLYEKKESDSDHEKRIIRTAKSLAFKDWICAKSLEKFDLRILILPKL